MSSAKHSKDAANQTMLDELLEELQQKTQDSERKRGRITKARALMRSIVNDALDGDQRMMTHVLKYVEKLDAMQATKQLASSKEQTSNHSLQSKEDWEMLFYFIWRWKPYIEEEIHRMQHENPDAFQGEHTHDAHVKLPWQKAVYGDAKTA